MGDGKEKGDTVNTVTSAGPSGVGKEDATDRLGPEAAVRMEEDFTSGFLLDGGEWSCDGDDIMVEVLGEEVFVDGIGSDGVGLVRDTVQGCDGVINGVDGGSHGDVVHGRDGWINGGGRVSAADMVNGCDGLINGVGSVSGGDQNVDMLILPDSSGGEVTEVKETVDAEQVAQTKMPINNAEPISQSTRLVSLKPGSSEKIHQASYLLPLEGEREFKISDLVWGKVKSHPWWPGQVYHPSEASEKAMTYHKKNHFLVAYFGDRSFAWNDASVLKPFQRNFAFAANRSNSESFQNAVTCALGELSKRVELGLACSCMPSDDYEKIRYQSVENSGIRDNSIRRDDEDESLSADSFNPRNFLGYIKGLAQLPFGGANRLELAIARAQLLSFYRLKGYCQLPEFQFCEGLPETEEDYAESSYYRRKSDLKNGGYNHKEGKSISDLMNGVKESADNYFSPDGKPIAKTAPLCSGPRKATESLARCSSATQTISIAKVIQTRPSQSLGIGDCIQRVATQLLEAQSLNNLLSQLQLAAKSPFENVPSRTVITFFLGVRSLAISEQRSTIRKAARKKKRSSFSSGDPETFEFKDTSDSYRTNMIIDNGCEDQPAERRSKLDSPSVPVELGKSQMNSRPNARKRRSVGNNKVTTKKITDKIVENKPDLSPTELVISFPELQHIPSLTNLNRMFIRFGSLWESETEVDENTSRARVIFKRCSDAEIAYNSARIFKIFGSIVVSYKLNYTPTVPFRASPPVVVDDHEHAIEGFQYESRSLF